MRSSIILAALIIAMAINPTYEYTKEVTTFIGIFLLVAMTFDVIEFFVKK